MSGFFATICPSQADADDLRSSASGLHHADGGVHPIFVLVPWQAAIVGSHQGSVRLIFMSRQHRSFLFNKRAATYRLNEGD